MSKSNYVFSGEFDLIADGAEAGDRMAAVDWSVSETPQGWSGQATYRAVDSGQGVVPAETILKSTVNQGLTPDTAIRFGLWEIPAGDFQTLPPDGARKAIRSWPSVIVSMHVPSKLESTGARRRDAGAMILFKDPVSYLLDKPIWGVFKNLTAGRLLAGGLLLAVGSDAAPSLEPALPGMPGLRIREDSNLRPADLRVPYAIASGERLGEWLDAIFGRLGVRLKMLGDGSEVQLDILAGASGDDALKMSLGSTVSAGVAVITGIPQRKAVSADLATSSLLDNPSIGTPRWIGDSPTIGRLYTSSELTFEQAEKIVGRVGGADRQKRSGLTVVTAQPGLYQGRGVSFDQTVLGADYWLVHDVLHLSAGGTYHNTVGLVKQDSWTPAPPPDRGMVVLSGVVHDSGAGDGVDTGQVVDRDEMCRIPVRLRVSQGEPRNGGASNGGGSGDQTAGPPGPELNLSVAGPMAGGAHGFVPGHRQGDVCHIGVHHPMHAEIIGFSYSDHRRIGDDMVDVTMGIVPEHFSDKMSGMVFVPQQQVEDEEKDEKNRH